MCITMMLCKHHGISNDWPLCISIRLFQIIGHLSVSSLLVQLTTSHSKLSITGHCAGNPMVTGEFPAQRASNAYFMGCTVYSLQLYRLARVRQSVFIHRATVNIQQIYHLSLLGIPILRKAGCVLTHYGIVMPYCDIDVCRKWHR